MTIGYGQKAVGDNPHPVTLCMRTERLDVMHENRNAKTQRRKDAKENTNFLCAFASLRLCVSVLMHSILVVLLYQAGVHAETGGPWGKDADLANNSNFSTTCQYSDYCPTPILGKFGETMIAFHQNVISPADGPRSHFTPSSSQYTLDAMRKYGFFQGVVMGCDRLMRENPDPWVYRTIYSTESKYTSGGEYMKYDPVP